MRKVLLEIPPELNHYTAQELTNLLSVNHSDVSEGYHLMTYNELKRESQRLNTERPKGFESHVARINLLLRRWGRI